MRGGVGGVARIDADLFLVGVLGVSDLEWAGNNRGVPVGMRDGLPTVGILRSRGVFMVPGRITLERSVHPLGVLVLGLVPAGVRARARLLELLNGDPLRISVRLLRVTSRASGGASPRRLAAFCGAFGRIGGRDFSKVVVANTPIRRLSFRRISC